MHNKVLAESINCSLTKTGGEACQFVV